MIILTTLSVQFWTLITFILLCIHHQHSSPELFHYPKLKFQYPLNNNFPFHFPLDPGNRLLEFLSLYFITLGNKWNHTKSDLCDRLISPIILSSRFIHVLEHVRISFQRLHCLCI